MIWPISFPTESHPFNAWKLFKRRFTSNICIISATCLLSYPFVPFVFVVFHSAVVVMWKLMRVFLVLCCFCYFQFFSVQVSVSFFFPTKVSKAIVTYLRTDVSAGLEVNYWVRGVWTQFRMRCQGLSVKSSIPLGIRALQLPGYKKNEIANPQKQFEHCFFFGMVLFSYYAVI